MKRLIVSLVILSLYGLADVGLTTVGLDLGLRETNPFVPIDQLVLHWAATTAFIVVNAIAVHWVARRLSLKHIARAAVSLITVFYIFVLIHNLGLIWRVTNV